MRSMLAPVLVGLVVSIATGCTKVDEKKAHANPEVGALIEEAVPAVSIDELDQRIAAKSVTPVDANGPGTRKKLGVIPGAVLLTDSEEFAPSELPADKSKNLVFYCANKQCGASHTAAAKAVAQGYKNVQVLPDGIKGWRDAGKQTDAI